MMMPESASARPEGRDSVVAGRVRMNLNAGWRFWLGDTPPAKEAGLIGGIAACGHSIIEAMQVWTSLVADI
jgi:hypothetical protein